LILREFFQSDHKQPPASGAAPGAAIRDSTISIANISSVPLPRDFRDARLDYSCNVQCKDETTRRPTHYESDLAAAQSPPEHENVAPVYGIIGAITYQGAAGVNFTDLTPGVVIQTPPPVVTSKEIAELASRYNPQWFHIDPARAP